MRVSRRILAVLAALAFLAACSMQTPTPANGTLRVLAVETFLADVTRQIAGEHATVDALIPLGLDPHAFEPTPQDVARIANSPVLVVNGGGVESWLESVLANAGGQRLVITAASGLANRTPSPGELAPDEPDGDPHHWLDPIGMIAYVENIRAGLSQADPGNSADYAKNAAAYTQELRDLDAWIQSQVAQIPPERRVLVTNHETFGYFADRYGFRIVGAILPSVSTGSAPSARDLAGLVEKIRAAQAPAIFLETGANPQLAEQIAAETGVRVVAGLYTHSITDASGPAASYLAMMRYNTTLLVEALR